MAHWIFDCQHVSQLVSESMDRKLSMAQRTGIRMHLFVCKFCARFRRQLLLIRKVLKRAAVDPIEPVIPLPPEAKNRIQLLLTQPPEGKK